MKKHVTFKWRNYTQPTPGNLKRFMEFWKGLFVVLTAGSIFNDSDKIVSVTILVAGYVLDRLVKFFAYAEEQEAKGVIEITEDEGEPKE